MSISRLNRIAKLLSLAVAAFLFSSSMASAQSPNLIVWLTKGDSLDHFGWKMQRAGDVNGDGFADIWILHEPIDPITTHRQSTLYLYHGGATMDTIPDFEIRKNILNISSIGDMNQDGFDDLMALYWDTTGRDWTLDYYGLHFGGPLLDTTPQLRFAPLLSNNNNWGASHVITGGSDLTADGLPDLVISEPSGYLPIGSIQVFSSSPTFDTVADLEIQANGTYPPYIQFGLPCVRIKNGGLSDWLATSRPSGDDSAHGTVYFYRTGAALDAVPDDSITPPADSDERYWGSLIRDIGDVDGDGFDDIVVNTKGTFFSPGYLYFGGKNGGTAIDTVWDVKIQPSFTNLEALGDVNNDGWPDFATFEYNRTWIYYGGPGMDGYVDMQVQTKYPGFLGGFGIAMQGLGDVNGDGIDDFAITAQIDEYGLWPGIVLIYAGYDGTPNDVGDDNTPALPGGFQLLQNYPNPFNGETTITFNVSSRQRLKLSVINVKGEIVETLVEGTFSAGEHKVIWKATDSAGRGLPSGVYIARLQGDRVDLSSKMLFVK